MHRYPLEDACQNLRARVEQTPLPTPTGATRDLYLDIAEHIVRAATPWMDDTGMVVDPYRGEPDQFATSRLVGALGHLIAAGRCGDLIPACVAGYEACLTQLHQPELSPEFSIKELMYAHATLKGKIETQTLARWQEAWAQHDPRASYNCVVNGLAHNFNVFALVGEFFKRRNRLADHSDLIEELLAGQRQHFTDHGMYRDPNDPMTYDLVVRQQLDLIMSYGYAGANLEWMREVSRRGALTALLFQSTTGQMPFGGRSNQFHFMEAHFACLCESQARFYRDQGDLALAGAFKRAGRRAIAMTVPWIMGMTPLRQTKQGFDPAIEHGIDSGGHYSVYGLLMASLCGTAYHLADESIEERITPAELGGYVFDLWPAFHKVFATCAGYHIEIDTRADPHKDASGLGRLHRDGVWPETALSASITATPQYSFAFDNPAHNLAIGPAWIGQDGHEHRLADFSDQIEDVRLEIIEQTEQRVAFTARYAGDLGGVREIVERYELNANGLIYSFTLDPKPERAWLLVPVIETDGQANATPEETPEGLRVAYRGALYEIHGPQAELTADPPAANRNALYQTWRIEGQRVHLRIHCP